MRDSKKEADRAEPIARDRKRRAGDPLMCKCPVCTRIRGVIENARRINDVRHKNNSPEAKGKRLYVVNMSSWTADGRD